MFFLIKYLIRLIRRRQNGGVDPATDLTTSMNTDAGADQLGPRPIKERTGPTAAARGPLALIAHQIKYDVLVSLRNPRARFFTFFFPILILVIFNGVFGNGHAIVDGHRIKLSEFYVPGIMAMSIIVASYAGLVVTISTLRETGVLKRRRATPVPPALLIAGQAGSTVAIAMVMSTLLLVISKVAYNIGFAPGALAAMAVTVLVGTISFACLAYAVSGLIGSPDAAQPIVQATMFPLYFISGVWIPTNNLSSGLRTIGELFPVEHLADGLHRASFSTSFTSTISLSDLGVLAAWGIASAIFAAARFSWLPSAATA